MARLRRKMRRVGGTPIEEAPVWALAILTVVLWLVMFPALVGFLNGFRLIAGGGWTVAAAAGVISLLLVVGPGSSGGLAHVPGSLPSRCRCSCGSPPGASPA
jgi:choline-glycine betaine transporter